MLRNVVCDLLQRGTMAKSVQVLKCADWRPFHELCRYKSYSHFGAGDIPVSSAHFQTMASQTPPETMVPQLQEALAS